MKKIIKNIFFMLIIILFVSCGKPKLLSELQVRKGIHYEVNKESPYTGKFISEYSNGQIKKQGNFKKGILNGNYKEYYSNGQLKTSTVYKNGIINGIYSSFYENGEPKAKLQFLNGEYDGLNIIYKTMFTNYQELKFLNGKVIEKIEYDENKNIIKKIDEKSDEFNEETMGNAFKIYVNILEKI